MSGTGLGAAAQTRDASVGAGWRPWLARADIDWRLVGLALVIVAATAFVPPLFRTAFIAAAFATAILAPMPTGTRGFTFAVMAGLATGTTAISTFAVSIFQAPITREFGWSQTEYSTVLTIATFVLVIVGPLAGRFFDRYGVRNFTLGSTVLVALGLMSLRWLTGSLLHFYLVFCLMQGLGIGTSSIPYARVVARWFREKRGQAFGTALAGVGIGGAVVSSMTQYFIGHLGWRDAYLALGLFMLCTTLPILFVWLRDRPEDKGLAPDGKPLATSPAMDGDAPVLEVSAPVGPSAAQSRRQPLFWRMLIAFFVMALGTGGVMLQLFPILRSHGISPEAAASIQGALGLALICGRAFSGYLMDRLFAPHVAAVIILFPLTGTALLAHGAGGWLAVLAAMFMGLSAGAEVDIIAYLITRYFGTRAYSENYGWLYAAWALGAGSAPMVSAMSMDRFGSYAPVLWCYVGLFALSSLLLARLGPYPQLEGEPAADRD
ncbi:MFS transporter [Novosphingobium resinovorum]|uniref:MFS transporter n=1 Tax=Novosphingobium resinovorum TaxID=158500 RepID=UPI002ED01C68|nr:MFS transporter [Novosphingobium resinovorum]